MRAFIIVVGVIFAFLGVLAATGWYWWHVHGESVVASSRAAMSEGRERGRAIDEPACLAEVLQRQRTDKDDGMAAVITRSLWLDGCLGSSKATASFCQGVPAPHAFVDMSTWVASSCLTQGSNPGCQTIYQQVAKYCGLPERAAKLAAASP